MNPLMLSHLYLQILIVRKREITIIDCIIHNFEILMRKQYSKNTEMTTPRFKFLIYKFYINSHL